MKLPVQWKERSTRFWSRLLPPRLLFLSVLLCFPGFLFQRNVPVLAGEVFFFLLLALFRRGSVRLLPPVLLTGVVTAGSLLSPFGRVLFRVGNFAVTSGALESGLRRGLALAGMVFLSQSALASRVTLPGAAGRFLTQMFAYMEALGREPLHFRRDGIIAAIDNRLWSVYRNCGMLESTGGGAGQRIPAGTSCSCSSGQESGSSGMFAPPVPAAGTAAENVSGQDNCGRKKSSGKEPVSGSGDPCAEPDGSPQDGLVLNGIPGYVVAILLPVSVTALLFV